MSDSLVSGLSAAVESAPQDVSLRLRLAELLLQDGHAGEALTHIGAAILLRPASASASALLATHPEFPKYVAMANKPVRGSANAAARRILGLRTDEPVKTGPAGKQKYTQHGRSIETVARFLQRSGAAEYRPTRLTLTLSGSGVAGGTVVVPADHNLYAELVALFEERSAR